MSLDLQGNDGGQPSNALSSPSASIETSDISKEALKIDTAAPKRKSFTFISSKLHHSPPPTPELQQEPHGNTAQPLSGPSPAGIVHRRYLSRNIPAPLSSFKISLGGVPPLRDTFSTLASRDWPQQTSDMHPSQHPPQHPPASPPSHRPMLSPDLSRAHAYGSRSSTQSPKSSPLLGPFSHLTIASSPPPNPASMHESVKQPECTTSTRISPSDSNDSTQVCSSPSDERHTITPSTDQLSTSSRRDKHSRSSSVSYSTVNRDLSAPRTFRTYFPSSKTEAPPPPSTSQKRGAPLTLTELNPFTAPLGTAHDLWGSDLRPAYASDKVRRPGKDSPATDLGDESMPGSPPGVKGAKATKEYRRLKTRSENEQELSRIIRRIGENEDAAWSASQPQQDKAKGKALVRRSPPRIVQESDVVDEDLMGND